MQVFHGWYDPYPYDQAYQFTAVYVQIFKIFMDIHGAYHLIENFGNSGWKPRSMVRSLFGNFNRKLRSRF